MANFVLSPSIVFKATYADGCPLVGGKVWTYLAGTTTPTASYQSEGGAANTNPVILNARGEANIWLDPNLAYKIEVLDADDNVVIPAKDNIKVGPTGFDGTTLATIGDLRDYTGAATLIYVYGYNEASDGCGGWFYFDAESTVPDNAVTVFATNASPMAGRWLRDFPGSPISIRYAGDPGTLDNSYDTLSRLVTALGGQANTVIFPPGTYTLENIETVVFPAGSSFEVQDGAVFDLQGASHLEIAGTFVAGSTQIFTGTGTAAFTGNQTTTPYWFGGSPSATGAANATAFALWKAAGAGIFLIPAGAWAHTGAFTLSTTIPTIFEGVLLSGAGPSIQYAQGAYYPGTSSAIRAATLNATTVNTVDLNATGDVDAVGVTADSGNFSTSLAAGQLTSSSTVDAQGDISSLFGGIAAAEEVTAGTTITAGGNITATSGYVQAKAGSGSLNYKAAGAGNVTLGTGDATLPANSLTANNSYIRIVCSGTTTSETPTIVVQVGGQTVFQQSLALGTGGTYSYKAEVLVFRTGAATSYCCGTFTAGYGTSPTITAAGGTGTATITWANANTITHNVTATNVKELTMFEIFPAV